MTQQELNNWSNGLYEELHTNWQKWSEQCELIKEKGYALFYSEVKINPDLMIIGYNPGWNKDLKIENLARKTPEAKYHDYYPIKDENDYAMAKKMRSLFTDKLDIVLRNSVKFNQLFFNSQNVGEWHRNVDENLRLDIEKYCLDTTFMIIQKLQPKLILTEGFTTFYRLMFHHNQKHITISDHYLHHKRILLEGILKNTPIIGLPHPTGARGISNEVWDEIRKKLRKVILG